MGAADGDAELEGRERLLGLGRVSAEVEEHRAVDEQLEIGDATVDAVELEAEVLPFVAEQLALVRVLEVRRQGLLKSIDSAVELEHRGDAGQTELRLVVELENDVELQTAEQMSRLDEEAERRRPVHRLSAVSIREKIVLDVDRQDEHVSGERDREAVRGAAEGLGHAAGRPEALANLTLDEADMRQRSTMQPETLGDALRR